LVVVGVVAEEAPFFGRDSSEGKDCGKDNLEFHFFLI